MSENESRTIQEVADIVEVQPGLAAVDGSDEEQPPEEAFVLEGKCGQSRVESLLDDRTRVSL